MLFSLSLFQSYTKSIFEEKKFGGTRCQAGRVCNLTLNDESGCCIVLLGQARWIELMSDEKNYNRHTIGLWAIQEKQAHWRSLLDLTPTGGLWGVFRQKKWFKLARPTHGHLSQWKILTRRPDETANEGPVNSLANPIFFFNFSSYTSYIFT